MQTITYHVALDTSAIHREGFYSGAMVRAKRLVEAGRLQLYLPDLVGREYITQVEAEVEDKLRRAEADLRALQRRVRPQGIWPAEIESAVNLVGSLRSRAGAAAKDAYGDWCSAYRMKTLSFDPVTLPQVMDDYFAGAGAFKKAKSRDDIPDAMIGASILALLREQVRVDVVVGDAAMRKYLAATEGVVAWEKLEDFLDQEEVAALVQELDEAQKLEALLEHLNSATFHHKLAKRLVRDGRSLAQIYVEESDISHVENLGIDCFGVSLNGIRGAARIEFGSAGTAGPGRWTIPATLYGTGRLHYVTDFQTFNDLSDFRRADIEEWSFKSGLSELREDADVIARGYVDVHFQAGMSNAELEEQLRTGSEAFSAALEIESAEISDSQWWNA